MKISIEIDNPIYGTTVFTKERRTGDIKKFLTEEGNYIETLCNMLDDKTENILNDFTDHLKISYTITVEK